MPWLITYILTYLIMYFASRLIEESLIESKVLNVHANGEGASFLGQLGRYSQISLLAVVSYCRPEMPLTTMFPCSQTRG